MDKLWLKFDHVFWDPKTSWIQYIDERSELEVWPETFSMVRFNGEPVLCMFNIGEVAIKFAEMSDQEVLKSAISTL